MNLHSTGCEPFCHRWADIFVWAPLLSPFCVHKGHPYGHKHEQPLSVHLSCIFLESKQDIYHNKRKLLNSLNDNETLLQLTLGMSWILDLHDNSAFQLAEDIVSVQWMLWFGEMSGWIQCIQTLVSCTPRCIQNVISVLVKSAAENIEEWGLCLAILLSYLA